MRILSLLLTASVLVAQPDGWNLLRGINPGQATHVHMLDGRKQSGGFISTADANIVIRQRTGDQTFAKDRIKKVSVRKGVKRWRNAGIGPRPARPLRAFWSESAFLKMPTPVRRSSSPP